MNEHGQRGPGANGERGSTTFHHASCTACMTIKTVPMQVWYDSVATSTAEAAVAAKVAAAAAADSDAAAAASDAAAPDTTGGETADGGGGGAQRNWRPTPPQTTTSTPSVSAAAAAAAATAAAAAAVAEAAAKAASTHSRSGLKDVVFFQVTKLCMDHTGHIRRLGSARKATMTTEEEAKIFRIVNGPDGGNRHTNEAFRHYLNAQPSRADVPLTTKQLINIKRRLTAKLHGDPQAGSEPRLPEEDGLVSTLTFLAAAICRGYGFCATLRGRNGDAHALGMIIRELDSMDKLLFISNPDAFEEIADMLRDGYSTPLRISGAGATSTREDGQGGEAARDAGAWRVGGCRL